jgi:iron complex outermembrane receptor protein
LHAALGNGFETPTLTEMAYTNGDKGFNNTLDASANHQQELGIDFQHGNINLSLTAFDIKTKNELVVDQSINGRTTYVNSAKTERKGVELSGSFEFNEAVEARVALNYLDATYTQGPFSSSQLPGVAKLNHYAQVNWLPLHNELLKIGISVNHRSWVAANDNNEIKAPAYTTADLAASGAFYAMQNIQTEWWLKLVNVTDENYVGSVIVNQSNGRTFEPANGRNLAAGIKFAYDF